MFLLVYHVVEDSQPNAFATGRNSQNAVICVTTGLLDKFLSDATAIEFTRNPDGLISALQKISVDPNQLKVANNATENMYIASPFRNNKQSSSL